MGMMGCALLLLLIVVGARVADCARILAVLPFPSKSQSIAHYAMLRLLTEKGHEVVAYSAFPPRNAIRNLTYIHVPTDLLNLANHWTYEEFKVICNTQHTFGLGAKELFDVGFSTSEDVFKNEQIKELLHSSEKFDLVFIEPAMGEESLAIFGHKFQAPVIAFIGFGTWSVGNWLSGNSLSTSYIPQIVDFPFTDKMSFTERLLNSISTVMTLVYYHVVHLPGHQKLLEKYYKDSAVPPVTDMLRDISITFVNAFQTEEYPRPYTPNIIPVGGVHMSSHSAPLPEDLKKFMDGAKEGVIYFSLGTVVPIHILPQEVLQKFVNVFRRVSQKVLWKIEMDNIPGLSDNVLLTKWAPQPTVLAHPNCVLFLTHGGMFSQHEALIAGVPVVGIPFFADQRYNVRFYESRGVGLKLEFTSSEDAVFEAVNTVLKDPKYRINAKTISRRIRDQPVSSADTFVFWTEYVLRHKGAHHLRPASAELRWYQLYLVDVLGTVLAAALVLLFLIVKIVCKVFSIFGLREKRVNISKAKKVN